MYTRLLQTEPDAHIRANLYPTYLQWFLERQSDLRYLSPAIRENLLRMFHNLAQRYQQEEEDEGQGWSCFHDNVNTNAQPQWWVRDIAQRIKNYPPVQPRDNYAATLVALEFPTWFELERVVCTIALGQATVHEWQRFEALMLDRLRTYTHNTYTMWLAVACSRICGYVLNHRLFPMGLITVLQTATAIPMDLDPDDARGAKNLIHVTLRYFNDLRTQHTRIQVTPEIWTSPPPGHFSWQEEETMAPEPEDVNSGNDRLPATHEALIAATGFDVPRDHERRDHERRDHEPRDHEPRDKEHRRSEHRLVDDQPPQTHATDPPPQEHAEPSPPSQPAADNQNGVLREDDGRRNDGDRKSDDSTTKNAKQTEEKAEEQPRSTLSYRDILTGANKQREPEAKLSRAKSRRARKKRQTHAPLDPAPVTPS